jgi:acyl-CoA synthetase (AMP-forming)/AMP-acid ligase II
LHLSGLHSGEISGPTAVLGRAVYTHPLSSSGLERRVFTWYAGTSAEIGNVFSDFNNINWGDLKPSGSLFLGVDTLFGPLYLGYGMTEGGAATMLAAHQFPMKLHTVGRPMPGNEIRLIDEAGREVDSGAAGEVVGRSDMMMTEYHNLPEKTREAEWRDAEGQRFIRTGDIGRFDEDGFLILLDRSKDVIISGGFNIYPSDVETELMRHESVIEAAVVGVGSERWGETPVAFVVLREGSATDAPSLKDWVNARLGKTQRLSDLAIVDALPRSPIGKLLKRELRDLYANR